MLLLCGLARSREKQKSLHIHNQSIKLGRMITYLDEFLPTKLHDPFITWPCEIRGSLTAGGSPWKRSSRHRLLVNYLILVISDTIKRRQFCREVVTSIYVTIFDG